MTIAISGENGFIGSYIYLFAKRRFNINAFLMGRPFEINTEKFSCPETIIHCASVHRDENPESVYIKNMEIHNSLIKELRKKRLKPNITMLSSIHENDGSPYGNSKKQGAQILEDFCDENNTKFLKFNLNNTFGPLSKPYQFSFVATFCYNILNDIPCKIQDRKISLSYIDDVVVAIIEGNKDALKPHQTSILEVHNKILYFKDEYINNRKIPKLDSIFEFHLFKTFISFIGHKI